MSTVETVAERGSDLTHGMADIERLAEARPAPRVAQGRRRGAGAGFSAGGLLAAALRTGLATSTASGSP